MSDREDESLADRWILARLNRTVAEVIRGLDEYRFNDAAAAVYQFVWHEFCDWYLELVKPVLYGKEDPARRRAAQKTLLDVLTPSSQAAPSLHALSDRGDLADPVADDGTSIMVSPFPAADESLTDPEAEREMGLIMEVITRIRNIRGEMSIAPSKKLPVIISAAQEEEKAVVVAHRTTSSIWPIWRSCPSREIWRSPRVSATGVVGSMRIFVLLEGLINIAEEKARLEKEMAKLEKDLAIVSRKLANRDFLEKAAEAVIRKEEEKYKDFAGQKCPVESGLQEISDHGSGVEFPMNFPVPKHMLDALIRTALAEDIGSGDVTTAAILSGEENGYARVVAKSELVIAGD